MSHLLKNGFTSAPGSPFAQSGMRLHDMARMPVDSAVFAMLDDMLNLAQASGIATPVPMVLLSAGGNDCVKDALLSFVRPKGGGPRIDKPKWTAHLSNLRDDYVSILKKFRGIGRRYGVEVPVIIHGYDHPISDGRFLIGTGGRDAWTYGWLTKRLGYTVSEGSAIMHALIDGLNETIATLPGTEGAGRVVHARLSGTLKKAFGAGPDWEAGAYKKAWENELHPTRDGFAALGNELAKELNRL